MDKREFDNVSDGFERDAVAGTVRWRGATVYLQRLSPSLDLQKAYLAASSHLHAGYSIDAIRKYLAWSSGSEIAPSTDQDGVKPQWILIGGIPSCITETRCGGHFSMAATCCSARSSRSSEACPLKAACRVCWVDADGGAQA